MWSIPPASIFSRIPIPFNAVTIRSPFSAADLLAVSASMSPALPTTWTLVALTLNLTMYSPEMAIFCEKT